MDTLVIPDFLGSPTIRGTVVLRSSKDIHLS